MVVDVTAHGAQSVALDTEGKPEVGAFDSSLAFEAALDVLRTAKAATPQLLCVLVIPAGDFFLPGVGNKWCLRLDFPVTVRGQGKTFTTLHGDDLRPGSTGNASKDMLHVGAPMANGTLTGVIVEDLAIRLPMPHSTEQSHAITVTGGIEEADGWVSGFTIRRCKLGPIGNGDGLYMGHRSEGIIAEDLEIVDCARQGMDIAGTAGDRAERVGFRFSRCRLHFDGYNPAHESGELLHIEPSNGRLQDRMLELVIEDCWSTGGVGLGQTIGAQMRRCHVQHLGFSKTHGALIDRCRIFGRPGDGGDGRGCTIVGIYWPNDMIAFTNCQLEIPEDGYALIQMRDYAGHATTQPDEERMGVEIGPTNRLRRFDAPTQPWAAVNVPADRRIRIAGAEEPW